MEGIIRVETSTAVIEFPGLTPQEAAKAKFEAQYETLQIVVILFFTALVGTSINNILKDRHEHRWDNQKLPSSFGRTREERRG